MACSQPRPIPLGSDTDRYGYIEEGGKFGMSVGQARTSAQQLMEGQGFAFAGATLCQDSSLEAEIECERGDLFDIYSRHSGLGHETIFLQVREERISRIGWSFVALQIDP